MTPSGLEAPLKNYLDDTVAEADVHRLWRGIQNGARQPRRGTVRRARWSVAVAAAAAMMLLVLGGLVWRGSRAGALVTTAGQLPTAWNVAAHRSEVVALADGSRIDLAPETRLDVLTNTGSSFVTSLKRGRSTFEVEPGGPRLWVVDCGFATVEVVGTKFSVERTPGAVRVTVERGKVRLRGEGFERTLVAGESATVENPDPVARRLAVPRERSVRQAAPTGEDPALPAGSAAAAGSARGAPGDAWDGLLAAADAARRRGDRAQAVRNLERVAAGCPDVSRRKLAAFTLARLQLDEDPRSAASTLEGALAGGMPRGLTEDALARLVEAHARAGNTAQARARAAEYEARYPGGRHLEEVRHWASRE